MNRIYLYPYAGTGGKTYFRQQGTRDDLANLGRELVEGEEIPFYCDDVDDDGRPTRLLFVGIVHLDHSVGEWFALIDETSFRLESRSERG